MTRSLKYLYNLYDPYISKLCNLYEISTSCSKMIIDITKTNDYIIHKGVIKDENIFPVLNNDDVKIFNIKDFILKNKKNSISNELTNSEKIDILIDKIDKKIQELEN